MHSLFGLSRVAQHFIMSCLVHAWPCVTPAWLMYTLMYLLPLGGYVFFNVRECIFILFRLMPPFLAFALYTSPRSDSRSPGVLS